MSDTQLAPARTLAQQIHDAARLLNSKPTSSPEDRDVFMTLVEQQPGMWRQHGDLAHQAQAALLKSVTMPEAMRASVYVGMAEMRRELAGDAAPRMLALLAEHAVTCWLRLQITEYAYTAQVHGPEGVSVLVGDYWERRLGMAQGRYLRALETLARVRRLAVPVQINIATNGGQQVNVGCPSGS